MASKAAPATVVPAAALVFSDGSRAHAVSADMRIETTSQSASRVEARLTAGAARFDVVHNPAREFIVQAGSVNIRVLGTVFTAAREGARVHVAVMVGRVQVDWGSGSTTLLQDGEGVFPPAGDADAEAAAAIGATDAAPTPSSKPVAGPTTQRWVELAKAGDFNAAYTRLAEAGSAGVADVPEELLLAADVSRRAGHVDQAARHLERLLARYPRDARAGVAAFTLGRIRLQLGNPAGAGAAFEQVATTGGALAEDAMYRAVMAFRQAGDSAKADRLQARYLATYPAGRYVNALQKQP
jgi:transmembrane sensor